MRTEQHHSNKSHFQQLQFHFNHQQELHVYTLLSKKQALELWEVRGGDDMRQNFLTEKLGVKLVGRKGLGSSADSIIASIMDERGKRKPESSSLTLKPGAADFPQHLQCINSKLCLPLAVKANGCIQKKRGDREMNDGIHDEGSTGIV
ncbi:hypothetical protein K7X08_030203 [Anisodus acutangulus]|uniref:Uncharacterized protein n=1 Tax=Anisodus acutangulus TaxID=402998 RepID=A0A9Q1LPC7_9SOLA|nr:hypothetical protein K7X08_030203 [Anisodus acutangulus]